MKTYRDRETGQALQALLWDGKATSVNELPAHLVERATVSFATGQLRIACEDHDGTWEMPVNVGEYLVIAGPGPGLPVAMEPDGFQRLATPT